MKRKTWVLIILTALVVAGFWYFKGGNKKDEAPKIEQQAAGGENQNKSPQGGQKIPKEFKFGADSDLNSELENINPEVLDSDFSVFETLVKNL